jgi:hypothetical protein
LQNDADERKSGVFGAHKMLITLHIKSIFYFFSLREVQTAHFLLTLSPDHTT